MWATKWLIDKKYLSIECTHRDSRLRIIHRDLKPASNILLDDREDQVNATRVASRLSFPIFYCIQASNGLS